MERWFTALDERRADVLVGMCNSDVAIRPFLARQTVDAVGYYGHDGIRQWVDSLDADTRIELELISIEVTTEQSAVVEAEVWFAREATRTGGLTFSLWRFDAGKVSEAIGYGSKEEALDAEAGGWH
ncbi:MAG TPA: hypothetical protein VH300_00250 [Thermoleophilaceae bacterium]|nr:hypothetical protein [Thermoleophilaceae bacterium]